MAPVGPKPSRQEKLLHLDAALTHVTKWRLAVDAGAHVGNWSLVMADRFERLMAFEPMASNRETWQRHLAGKTNAELFAMALGDRHCKVRMDGTGHSKHYATPDDAGDVEMVTLDSFALTDLDFLKVDCEGADTLVLRGAAETLKRCRPVVIVESAPKFELRYGLEAGAPMKFLEDLGARSVATYWYDHIFVFPEE